MLFPRDIKINNVQSLNSISQSNGGQISKQTGLITSRGSGGEPGQDFEFRQNIGPRFYESVFLYEKWD